MYFYLLFFPFSDIVDIDYSAVVALDLKNLNIVLFVSGVAPE